MERWRRWMQSGLQQLGLQAALAPMAVAASVSTTVSLQVCLRAHASMVIACVDVCSRRVPSVSAGAEFFQQRHRVASTRCRPSLMVHARRTGQRKRPSSARRARFVASPCCTGGATTSHDRVGPRAMPEATTVDQLLVVGGTSVVGGQTAAVAHGGDHWVGLLDPLPYIDIPKLAYVTDVCNGRCVL